MTFNNSTNQPCNPGNRSFDLVLMFLYSLVFLVGLIFNSFTLWFHFSRARPDVSKSWVIYLKNLTAADFLLCLGLPLRIADYAGGVNIHRVYCAFGAPLLYVNMYTSILLIGYIAASRYMKIFHPMRTSFLMTKRCVHIISVTTWVLFLVPLAINILLTLDNESTPGVRICDDLHSELAKRVYKAFHAAALTVFLAVLLSLVFFYWRTSRRVLQVQQNQMGSSNSRKLAKSRRNMLVLVGVFCVCFLPYHLVRLPYVLLRQQCPAALYYLKEVTVLVSVFNICLDPLMYVFLCKDFREQLNLQQMFSTKDNSSVPHVSV